MSAHTKGPWFIQVDSETGDEVVGRKAWIQARPGCPHVLVHADSGDGDENVLANARLIAAAPELLAACQEARQIAHHDCDFTGHSPWCQRITDAIAKATGESA